MSQTPCLPPTQRHQLIKEYIATETQTAIAELCGCERRTIVRDIAEMKRTGEWWDWLEYELHRLHRDGDIDDATKYKEIAKLYGKQFIKEKGETSLSGAISLKWMTNDDDDHTDHPV